MFKLYRLPCFRMDGPHAENETAYLNPKAVESVVRRNGVSIITTKSQTFYSSIPTERILKGLEDVAKLNEFIALCN